MLFSDQGKVKTLRKRRRQRRQKKVDGVNSIFSSVLKINEALTDIPGMLNSTKETQEALESAETELRYLGENTLPIVNTAGKVLTGVFAIGSFFILREIVRETRDV